MSQRLRATSLTKRSDARLARSTRWITFIHAAIGSRLKRLLPGLPTRDDLRRAPAFRWLGPLLDRDWLWRLRGRSVARGAAIGVFIGILIPFGQMPVAVLAAVAARAHLPSAALATLITNPFTTPFIVWSAHTTGALFLGAPSLTEVLGGAATDAASQGTWLMAWLERLLDLGAPLLLGLGLYAVAGALISYALVKTYWRWRVKRRRERLA